MKDALKELREKLTKAQKGEDLPKVTFESLEGKIEVGRWLNIMNSIKCKDGKNYSNFYYLETAELVEKDIFVKKDLNKICIAFGKVLKLAGVSSEKNCYVTDYDRKKFSFKGYFADKIMQLFS